MIYHIQLKNSIVGELFVRDRKKFLIVWAIKWYANIYIQWKELIILKDLLWLKNHAAQRPPCSCQAVSHQCGLTGVKELSNKHMVSVNTHTFRFLSNIVPL